MERFVVKFSVENDAFADGNLIAEIVRLLRETIKKLEDGKGSGPVCDENGNNIGYWGFLTKGRK